MRLGFVPAGEAVGLGRAVTLDLAAFGIQARFAEQWDLLHAASGEVHCGTNALRAYPALRWWEVAR
jgi:hypothetical protein